MQLHPELITKSQDLQKVCEQLSLHDHFAFDTEFIRESTFYPKLELIQLATREDAWLVDIQAFQRHAKNHPETLRKDFMPLIRLFEDPKILKIAHAAQADQECIYFTLQCLAKPILDTSIGAALCGFGDSVGLAALMKKTLGVHLKKGQARTHWSSRPLPSQLVDYALGDVAYLVALGDYLLERLDQVNRREWALKLSAETAEASQYEPNDRAIAERLARSGKFDATSCQVLLELVRWRERRVRELDVPRRWLAEDGVLIDLARVQPKDLKHLMSFRGLNKKEAKENGEALLKIIQKALKEVQAGSILFKGGRHIPPTVEEEQAVSLLRCFLGILADQREIAVRYVAVGTQFLALIRESPKTTKDLEDLDILSPEGVALVGQELIDFIHGKKAIGLCDSSKDRSRLVKIVSLTDKTD